jgi:hypothetical protein
VLGHRYVARQTAAVKEKAELGRWADRQEWLVIKR